MSWDLKFSEPVTLSHEKPLVTLRDASVYITALPLKVYSASAWENAMGALVQAAELGGPIQIAQIALICALRAEGRPASTWE